MRCGIVIINVILRDILCVKFLLDFKINLEYSFLISGGDRLDHFFLSDDCGLSDAAFVAPADLNADNGGAVSPDDDNADTGSVIEDSVEAAAGDSKGRSNIKGDFSCTG